MKRTAEEERVFHRDRMRKRTGNTGNRQRCTECDERGHNARTCAKAKRS